MDYALNEQRIAQYLIARDLSGLFELLLRLKGLTLDNHYTLRWLYAVGGQNILYLAEGRDGQTVIIKMAFLPYHRIAYISTEDIRKARQRLEKEATLLKLFCDTILPKFCDLIYASNPLHSLARGEDVVNREPYLVMEFIQGRTLHEIMRATHQTRQPNYEALEWLAWQVASTAANFSLMILRKEVPYLYSDFTPLNIILTDDVKESVRILDAGSLISLQTDNKELPPFNWAYIPPEYYEAYDKGKSLWPTPIYVMYTLGKVLWELLTNRQPYPAEDPDLTENKLKNYSSLLQSFISRLINRQYDDFEQMKKAVDAYSSAQPLVSKISELFDVFNEISIKKFEAIKKTGTLQFFDSIKDIKIVKVHEAQLSRIQRLRYSPDGKYIAIACANNIEILDAYTLLSKRRFNSPHLTPILSLDFDATGRYLASGSGEGTICFWHIDSDDALWQHRDKEFNGLVALDAKGECLIAATAWRAFVFFPQKDVHKEQYFEGTGDHGISIAVNKWHPLLAVGGLWGMRIWDTQSSKEIGVGQRKFRVDEGMLVEQIAFGNEGQLLAALSLDVDIHKVSRPSIKIWELPSYNLLEQVKLPSAKITDFRLASKGQLMFVGTSDGRLLIWKGKQITEYTQLTNSKQISSLDFASDQQNIAISTLDGAIYIYHLDI